MLGKLVSHEWKDSWKIMSLLNAAVLILSIIGIVFFNADNAVELFDSSDIGQTMGVFVYSSYSMIYVLSILALSIGSTLYFYVRFYKNLYTDQGYLMHTLPVTETELIWSKAIVAIIWRIIGTLIMCIGISSVLYSFFQLRLGWEWDEVMDAIEEVFEMGPMFVTVYIILGMLIGLGSIIFTIFKGYAAISIGQLASKNKVLASVGAYFGLHIGISIVSNIVTQFSMIVILGGRKNIFNYLDEPGWFFAGFMAVSAALIFILCAVCYIITRQIMKNRLNLE